MKFEQPKAVPIKTPSNTSNINTPVAAQSYQQQNTYNYTQPMSASPHQNNQTDWSTIIIVIVIVFVFGIVIAIVIGLSQNQNTSYPYNNYNSQTTQTYQETVIWGTLVKPSNQNCNAYAELAVFKASI